MLPLLPRAAAFLARARARWPDLLALGVFATLSVVLALRHEPWRDEAQAWLIARDSPGIPSMLGLLGYEGSPGLWHLILHVMAEAGLPYRSIAGLHTALIIAAVAVLFRYAPFPRYQKVLLAGGYFLLYEYNAIARSYVLSVLLLFLIAAAHPGRFERPVRYAALLALLANTNVHSLVIAGVAGAAFALQLSAPHVAARRLPGARAPDTLALVPLAAGFGAAVLQLLPPADLAPHLRMWDLEATRDHFYRTAVVVGEAFLPHADASPLFWDRPWLREAMGRAAAREDDLLMAGLAALGVVTYLLSLVAVWRSPHARYVYLAASLGIIAIFHFKYPGSIRHHGLIWLALVYAAWIAALADREAPRSPGAGRARAIGQAALVLLLVAQVTASPVAVHAEVTGTFSASRDAAAFLLAEGLVEPRTLIITNPGTHPTSLLPYLPEGTRFYALEYEAHLSYMVWTEQWYESRTVGPEEALVRIRHALATVDHDRAVFLSNGPSPFDPTGDLRFVELAWFDADILIDEDFYIYRVERGGAGASG